MAKTKNPSRKRKKAKNAGEMDTVQPDATISSLPDELIQRILSLTDGPARFASTCKSWNSLLSVPSNIWEEVKLYGSKFYRDMPKGGGSLPAWLQRRVPSIRRMSFIRVKDAPFINLAMGLLAFAPLEELSFTGCQLSDQVLMSLRVTTGLKALRLDVATTNYNIDKHVSDALDGMTGLEDLAIKYGDTPATASGSLCQWPKNLTLKCTALRRLTLEDFSAELPINIGNLERLECLTLAGPAIYRLPPDFSRLTALRSLRNPDRQSSKAKQQGTRDAHAARDLDLSHCAPALTTLTLLEMRSMSVPEGLASLTALKDLSLGRLQWTETSAARMRTALSSFALTRLRLHDCRVGSRGMEGLPALLGHLPHLKAVSLDGNSHAELQLGPRVHQYTAIDLSRNRLLSVPDDLRRATACRELNITLCSPMQDVLQLGVPDACPLLQMPALQKLAVLLPKWEHDDVETVVALRRALDRRRGPRRSVKLLFPRPDPEPAAGRLVQGEYDEDSEEDFSDHYYSEDYSEDEHFY